MHFSPPPPLTATQNAGPIFYQEPEDARVKKNNTFPTGGACGQYNNPKPMHTAVAGCQRKKNALKNGSPFFNVII